MEPLLFAKIFDHSILRPDSTGKDVGRAAEVAARLGTATLMVQPHYIRLAIQELRGTAVPVGAVIAFPHGNETPATKAFQAHEAVELGATEIDMVMSIPALRNGDKALFVGEIEGVIRAAPGMIVKVITENCYLDDREKQLACEWIVQAGAHFVKTSTGFAASGATTADVALMYRSVAGRCQVKASGGIQKLEDVLACLAAGARRIGTSRTEELVRDFDTLPPGEKTAAEELVSRILRA